MRKYKENQELDAVICNGCGKRLAVKNGMVREGVFQTNYTWDYFSEKDGDLHRWDLCEDCYDRIISQFLIGPEVEEQVEII